MILSQQFNTTASRVGAKPAFRYLGKETHYGELKISIARLSYLYQNEVGSKARVAFLTRNAPAFISTFFALSNIRAVTIPMDPDRSPDELIEWLKDSKATHLAVSSDLVGKGRELMQSSRLGLPIIEIEKKTGGEYDQTFTAAPDNLPQDIDIILLLRTSGRTGKPKFVPMNHKQVIAMATSIRAPYRMTATDRFFCELTWGHPFSLVHGMLMPILNGACTVIGHGLEGMELATYLQESKVNRIVATPPFLFKWLNTYRVEKKLPVGIKSVTVGIGTLSLEMRKAFSMLKIGVLQTYGQAEAGWTITMEDLNDTDEVARGYVGRGLAGNKYKIIDRNGDEIDSKGEREGMLAVMGPSVMTSYFERDKETKISIRGTWLYTGDFVRAEGADDTFRVTFLGRKEDAFFGLAGRIFTADPIDAVARKLGGVQDAAGFVVPKKGGGADFGVAIIKNPGNALNESQVLSHCKAHLPGEIAPVLVVFTDAIPRDPGGNINRAKLAAPFVQG